MASAPNSDIGPITERSPWAGKAPRALIAVAATVALTAALVVPRSAGASEAAPLQEQQEQESEHEGPTPAGLRR